ncbi:MAG: hypothetical protein JSS62_00120 [Verrucomicrobia bacterium]|nr:hypothetical protein [Verrucomicrobiota bacterium]MBS0646541.1 hypothetical protein [Verrucomicrobiota bacterium]
MNNKTQEQTIAYLEFANDQLLSEIHHVDRLLKLIGLSDGLETLKSAALELIEEDTLNQ